MDALADMLGLYHPGEDWNKGSGDVHTSQFNASLCCSLRCGDRGVSRLRLGGYSNTSR